MKRVLKIVALLVSLTGLSVWGGNTFAAACTSIANTAWNVQTTWGGVGVGCVGAVGGIPGAADTVTIATNVTLDAARSVTSLTVNLGSTLTLNTFTLTVSGNIIVNGTVDDPLAGANGIIQSTGAAAVVSGNGGFSGESRLYFAGAAPSIAAGSTLSFIGTSQLRAGRNGGATVAGSVLTIDGTLTSTIATAGNFLRLYANSTIISATGVINAAPSEITYQTAAATLTNNGTVTILNVVGNNAANNWTNAAGSTLNVSGTLMATGSLTANAAVNTVNYSGAAQTGEVTTYDNLTLSGSGAKTFATTPTVNNVLSMQGTATVVVTGAGVVTYGVNATLKYNTATARTVSSEEWITPFAASGGVIIANTGVITLDTAKVFNASIPLTINPGATLATNNLQVNFGGNFVNGGTFTAGSSPIIIANTMVAQSIAGFTTTGLVSLTKTAGTATFTGNVNGAGLTINGAGGTLDLGAGLTHTFTGAWTTSAGTLNASSSTLNIGGSCSAPPPVATFTAGTGTVNWNAAGAQTVCQYAYNNLTLSNSGAKTMTGVTSIGGNLDISGTATMTGNAAFTITGALNYASTAGTTTLTAATPISIGTFNQSGAGGTLNNNGNTITVTGTGAATWTKSAGTFTATGTVIFTGAAPQIGASNFSNLTINVGAGNTATLTGNVSPSGNLTVSTGTLNLSTFTANRSAAGGTITVANGTTLDIGGTNSFPANYTTHTIGATSTVTYSGTNQSVAAEGAPGYGNLTLNGSGIKTAAGSFTTRGDLTISGVTFAIVATVQTVNGNISNTGTHTVTTGNITLSGGAAVHTLSGNGIYGNLILNDAQGATLTGSPTVSGVLTLTNGIFTTSGNILEVTSNCTTGISGGGAAAYVQGNLTLHYPTNAGTTTCTFLIGSAAAYSPATVDMLNVTSTLANSSLTARTNAGDHADTTANISGVDATKSVNRYWTLTAGGSLAFATYNTTFTFVAGNIDGGAATANFIIARKSSGAWNYPTMGAKNPTNTAATGMTQAGGFGEFVIGERKFPSLTILKSVAVISDPVNGVSNPKFIPGAVAEYTITISNSGGPVDNNTTVITDPIPANTKLYVNDIGGGGSGPVLFTQGGTSSTLTYTFTALNDAGDDVSFSNDGGTTYTATPTFDASGCDNTVPAITNIRINPKGIFAGSTGPNPSFQLKFRVCVK